MSFYTSLTGLNAATTELSVTSNNIANAGTAGFKRSSADFGDIFASTPLQKAGSIAGSGVALNKIMQEHTQGNVEFSSNTLDLAITGDGFFKLKTVDGAEMYTRNGGFMLDDQNQMVNSAGQALQILPVDSINNANFEAQTTGLTVPRKTVQEFVTTSQINLGLNLPSSATPITEAFNANKPETYHKTTAFTTYSSNGKAQLATIYYVKTSNPTDASPYSKWQTYVTIDGQDVRSALTQSASAGDDKQFIDKYGNIKTQSELDALARAGGNAAQYLITAGTTYRKLSLDNLQAAVDSKPASVATTAGTAFKDGLNLTNGSQGVNFAAIDDAALSQMIEVRVNGSDWTTVGLSRMRSDHPLADKVLSGKEIATELTNEINRAFGDDKQFDFTRTGSGNANDPGRLVLKRYVVGAVTPATADANISINVADIIKAENERKNNLGAANSAATGDKDNVSYQNSVYGGTNNIKSSGWQVAAAITKHLSQQAAWNDIKVEYDAKNQGFKFHNTGANAAVPGTPDTISVGGLNAATNTLFNVGTAVADSSLATASKGTATTKQTASSSEQLLEGVRGNGSTVESAADQLLAGQGITVSYAGNQFTFSSGVTGDGSSIEVRPTMTGATLVGGVATTTTLDHVGGNQAIALFGFSPDATKPPRNNSLKTDVVESPVNNIPTQRGAASTPAFLTGNAMGVDTGQAFNVTAVNQSITAVIDGVTNTIKLDLGQYNIDTFQTELAKQLNLMADANGKSISNVKVGFDTAKTALTVTGGTATSRSFIQLIGSQDWGLEDVDAAFGKTSQYAKIDSDKLSGSNLYVRQNAATGQWEESIDAQDFEANNVPYWSPIFLDRGEITFDSAGALVSPATAYELESTLVTGNTVKIAYTGSTQFNQAFAAISQSQDGKPEGDINGISIGDDGLIVASYSNGSQKSLGKVVIANFNSSTGLKQLGDAAFVASGESGEARLGEAGSAGFGTIRSGSRERSNVDLTNELVDLISAQRNFQANAKAIETNSAMTSAIINIRS
ncbi:MAG: flagellar biosynthesis protein FlgE [Gammaproteobacteria bacterium]|nr:flagellar biosynthesis protein FlgE [Gammaproteobacteria bacterium]HBJ90246.1 flagellar biosynthesis protein FlgE [Gammaproteobacteria bacterium]